MKPARTVVVVALVLLTAVTSGCSNAGRSRTLDPSGSSGPSPPGDGTASVQKWIAVFRMEADPHDLSEDTAEILAIVGGAIVVSPVACFEGVPADYPLDSYLLGVVGPTKDALDEILAEVDRTVIFEGRVRTMCLD
jgi:hypothetical protein